MADLYFKMNIEPGAASAFRGDGSRGLSVEESLALSQAISLKRIADAMTGPTNEWGETMAEAVGGNLRRALQDISSVVHSAMNAGRRG